MRVDYLLLLAYICQPGSGFFVSKSSAAFRNSGSILENNQILSRNSHRLYLDLR
jgi:hypothetical protein